MKHTSVFAIAISLVLSIATVSPVFATDATAATAAATAVVAQPQGKVCQRADVSGLSVPEVLFVWPEQKAAVAPYADAAQTLHDAMDYLQVNYHQNAWDACAYDGIVLVTTKTKFPTLNKQSLRAARETTMFSLGNGFPVYVNVDNFEQAVMQKYQGPENKQKRIAMAALYLDQSVQRLNGSVNAGASEALMAKLEQDGLLATPNSVQRGGQVAPAGYVNPNPRVRK
jgi:hypothetical protein